MNIKECRGKMKSIMKDFIMDNVVSILKNGEILSEEITYYDLDVLRDLMILNKYITDDMEMLCGWTDRMLRYVIKKRTPMRICWNYFIAFLRKINDRKIKSKLKSMKNINGEISKDS